MVFPHAKKIFLTYDTGVIVTYIIPKFVSQFIQGAQN